MPLVKYTWLYDTSWSKKSRFHNLCNSWPRVSESLLRLTDILHPCLLKHSHCLIIVINHVNKLNMLQMLHGIGGGGGKYNTLLQLMKGVI